MHNTFVSCFFYFIGKFSVLRTFEKEIPAIAGIEKQTVYRLEDVKTFFCYKGKQILEKSI